VTSHNRTGIAPRFLPLLTIFLCLATAFGFAQSEYVGRYDLFAGFSNVSAPFVNNLEQPGFGMQFGVLNRKRIASGFDYSVQSGTTNLTPNLLPNSLQRALAAELPPGYKLSVPTNLTIQTFTGGSQYVYRHFHSQALFLHPVLSAFRVEATPRPTDPIAAVVSHILVPKGTKRDWVGAYGLGGGTDIHVSQHLSARVQMDAAWTHPMNDILAHGGWIYRFSVGPAFHFGRNVAAPRLIAQANK